MGTVITELLGGLGNQMFQYAMGRTLSLFQGSALLMDTRALEAPGPQTPRRYGLDVFDVRAERAAPEQLHSFHGRRVSEPGPRYQDGVTRLEGNVYLHGYWQCERYFRALRPTLKRDFNLKQAPLPRNQDVARAIKRGNSVAVHIRRGDYVSRPQAAAHHGSCSLDYYRSALEQLKQRHGKLRVYAFSDDPDWVREHFTPSVCAHMGLTIVSGNQHAPHEDLWLMQQCRHFVIANSSFSWWAAWLGQTRLSTVMAPQRWVVTPGFDTADVVPQNWVRVAG